MKVMASVQNRFRIETGIYIEGGGGLRVGNRMIHLTAFLAGIFGGSLILILMMPVQTVRAAEKTISRSPYVTFAPDGRAWTTNAGDKGNASGTGIHYKEGETVELNTASKLASLKTGQHYYKTKRTGDIPIAYWRVEWAEGQCIHNSYPEGDYHGLTFGKQNCFSKHYSGWTAYCADCGEAINNRFVYMSAAAAKSIEYFRVQDGLDYYYLCPVCNNLEQGYQPEHYCKEISYNRYLVVYDPNPTGNSFQGGEMKYGGYTPPSIHMYNDISVYEGQTVTPVTRLTPNAYNRIGYRFLGWNTKPDGSGTFFEDGARILNLTAENWDGMGNSGTGVVTLYAQWELTESTLKINPDGGSYDGKDGYTVVNGKYGTVCRPNGSLLLPPSGYRVSFHTNGGTACAPVTGTRHFTEWSMVQPFGGTWRDGMYQFTALHGTVDVLKACYESDSITLPKPERTGYSFGGWYYDAALQIPAGGAGDRITPTKNLTLYAQWVDLTLKAEDNYISHNGVGAVNLSWNQADGNNKTYILYQSRNLQSWSRINTVDDIGSERSVKNTFSFVGRTEKYTVPYTGVYSLKLSGAQGAGYGSFSGGKGGGVEATVWLRKDEVLSCTVGGQNGFNGGGKGDMFGNGGGCTVVSSDRQGVLAVAGGGGSASESGNGGEGGSTAALLHTGYAGEDGNAGGGGGFLGGMAGELICHFHDDTCRHVHVESCCLYHKHSEVGGSCYTYSYTDYIYSSVQCGDCGYWGGHYMWNTKTCGKCGGSNIHPLTKDVYELTCGKTTSTVEDYLCGKDESYICGYEEGQVLSSKPAYGGSSYVNTGAVLGYSFQPGTRAGNGYIALQAKQIGFVENLSLQGILARDLEAPDIVAEDKVAKRPLGENKVLITWDEPEDNGTVYYHKTESYLKGSASPLCESNVTKNTLVSGIRGYYYRLDRKENTEADTSGSFTTAGQIIVQIQDYVQYLHLAAVDIAGNIGGTTHIRLDTESVNWNLYTGQLRIEIGQNVYRTKQENTYYVRCDGITPFLLQHEAYMDGRPTEDYQLNYTIYETRASGQNSATARNTIYTPSAVNPENDTETGAEELIYSVEGTSFLGQYPYYVTRRSDRGRNLDSEQKFTLGKEANGLMVNIIPRTGADCWKNGKKEIQYSDLTLDYQNGITVIGDGEGPVIRGLEILQNRDVIDRLTEMVCLTVTADDTLSGVDEFYVKVKNQDNFSEKIFYPEQGIVQLVLTEENPLFTGNFTVIGYAADNVGNETEVSCQMTEFALETRIERILEPHLPVFKCGESGILYITTYGYADRVEVEFPAELTAVNPELNQTYDYTDLQMYCQESKLQFMIPLYLPANRDYVVTVRAYKGDKELKKQPSLSTIEVAGTVLGELRTRLR